MQEGTEGRKLIPSESAPSGPEGAVTVTNPSLKVAFALTAKRRQHPARALRGWHFHRRHMELQLVGKPMGWEQSQQV